MRRFSGAVILLVLWGTSAVAQEINVLAWNLESIGSDPEVIAEQIAEFDGYELMGFSETDPDNFGDFLVAAATDEGAAFDSLVGTTGGSQKLMLVWNADRFQKLDELEMLASAYTGGRAPLAVKLQDTTTGQEFWFMVNHLYRSNVNKRNMQARDVREWMRLQDIPTIVVGDLNMDYDLPNGPGNEAFDILREGNHARWVEPTDKIKTQSSNQFNSILDFVFINDDAAAAWTMTSRILQIEDEFVPTNEKSDHRPIEATITAAVVPPSPGPGRFALAAPSLASRGFPSAAVGRWG